jgi:hypothetical protein
MIKCKICEKEFKNNLGGNLTLHIQNIHNISFADYYILIELNDVEPKCQCGLCNERPNFYRGKYSKFAIGHEKYDWQEQKYIELFGQPKCQNPNCNNLVCFYRGKPQKYCSHKCQPNNWNQNKVKQTVKEKYYVDNVFQLVDVKEKSKKTLFSVYGVEHASQSPILKEKSKETSLNRYGVEYPQSLQQFKEKQKQTILNNYGVDHYSKTNEFKELASKNMCNYNENVITNHKIKHYKNTKLYYQSLHEYRFLLYCEEYDLLKHLNNSPTFKYLNIEYGKWHLPDFKYKDNFIIEIKSSYWLKRQGGWNKINAKKESIEAQGYQYIFILDENYDEFCQKCL